MANEQQRLIEWINTHDCGVLPCAVLRGEQIVIRVESVNTDTKQRWVEETVVRNYREARDALGY